MGHLLITAAIPVLQHQDPLRLPNAQWHFLPAMAYVNVAEYKPGYLIHRRGSSPAGSLTAGVPEDP